ncbi:MAG: hypothetical protein HKP56_05960 [Anderseniella sp.]|nr:hypothetical protein [Anderseniella sp.]
MSIKLIVSSAMGLALFSGVVHAQSVEAFLASYNQDPALTIAVSDAVSSNVREAEEFCRVADDAVEQVQVYVGAGLAGAHQYLVSVNDFAGAGDVKLTVCTCERTRGQILSSFANGIGALERDVCSSAWRGVSGGTPPGVFQINVGGGGNGVSRN